MKVLSLPTYAGVFMIYLQEATLNDGKKAYKWLYSSDYSSMINDIAGTPNIPSFEEFEKDYEDYFFDNSSPEKGRAYLIILKNGSPEEIGFISYTAFHLRDGVAELDIWLKGSKFIGKGYGTSALKLLSRRLFSEGFHTLIIRPSQKNIRAIRSYEKSGFRQGDLVPEEFYRKEFIEEYAAGDFGGGDRFMVMKKVD